MKGKVAKKRGPFSRPGPLPVLVGNNRTGDVRGRLCWTLSAFLSTQKSAQKSKNTQKSALESKFTLLSAQKSAQKSGFAQKKAQMSSFTQKRAHKSGPLKKVLKRGDTQKSETLKIVWWTRSVFFKHPKKCSKEQKHSKKCFREQIYSFECSKKCSKDWVC